MFTVTPSQGTLSSALHITSRNPSSPKNNPDSPRTGNAGSVKIIQGAAISATRLSKLLQGT